EVPLDSRRSKRRALLGCVHQLDAPVAIWAHFGFSVHGNDMAWTAAMARTPEQIKWADAAARDEILERRPDLKGKSLEAIKRILRRKARLSLRPRRSVKSE